MRNEVIEAGKFLCPICNEQIDCKGNVTLFNKHVDKCLVQSEKASNPQTVDQFENKSEPRSLQSKSTKNAKSKKGSTATLKDFFKQK
jgi:hypothetical protein